MQSLTPREKVLVEALKDSKREFLCMLPEDHPTVRRITEALATLDQSEEVCHWKYAQPEGQICGKERWHEVHDISLPGWEGKTKHIFKPKSPSREPSSCLHPEPPCSDCCEHSRPSSASTSECPKCGGIGEHELSCEIAFPKEATSPDRATHRIPQEREG